MEYNTKSIKCAAAEAFLQYSSNAYKKKRKPAQRCVRVWKMTSCKAMSSSAHAWNTIQPSRVASATFHSRKPKCFQHAVVTHKNRCVLQCLLCTCTEIFQYALTDVIIVALRNIASKTVKVAIIKLRTGCHYLVQTLQRKLWTGPHGAYGLDKGPASSRCSCIGPRAMVFG